MKTLFKKLDVTGVAVLLLAFFVAVGFTATTEMRQAEWYEVTIIDDEEEHDNPENQGIEGALDEEPVFPCDEEDGTICAIQIDMKSHNEVPTTVAEADSLDNLGLIEILESRFFD